ncbi:hypothetical protein, partial [Absiella sp. AM09-50]|uniref:hypothetical protein n=2 Tax=unclassified Amedibacterium TaxID=3088137 RepID=UPI000E98CBFA
KIYTGFFLIVLDKGYTLLWMGIILICFYTKKFGFLDLLLIPIVDDLINNKNRVNAILKKNKLVYLALFFSFIYTIIYNKVGFNGRGQMLGLDL